MSAHQASLLIKTAASAFGLARLLTAAALLFLMMMKEVNSSAQHLVPLGEVFNAGSGSGEDGQCTDPEFVPECADYYAGSNDVELRKFEQQQSSNPSRLRVGRKIDQDLDSY